MIFSIFLFLIIIAVIVISHEFGHFLFSRLYGVKVEEFGFGLPPRILSFQGKKTLYSLNLLPLGGFVKIKGEEKDEREEDSFSTKPIIGRFLIIFSGALFNVAVGYLLFSFLTAQGIFLPADEMKKNQEQVNILVMNVLKGSAAEMAGLKKGDLLILAEDNLNKIIQFKKIKEVQDFMNSARGKTIKLKYLRSGQETNAAINIPETDGPALGIGMEEIIFVKTPFYLAPLEGAVLTLKTIKATAAGIYTFIKNLIFPEPAFELVAGPVGLVAIIDFGADFGFSFLLYLVALLSVSIAVINILPFPALDGGRLLFLGIETILKRNLNYKITNLVHNIGFIVLISFMLLVTYFDIQRFF